jgi:DNA-binding transcriptional ArsR family regulator
MAAAQERRPATTEELKALAHPLRMRILRLCLDEARTNKELADALQKDPATVLHHVRLLLRNGFLEAEPLRVGARGALEKPYRATRLSWRLDLDDVQAPELTGQVEMAMIDAHREELADALAGLGTEAVWEQSRFAMRLSEASQHELRERLYAVLEDFHGRDDPRGERLSFLISVHRRRPSG